MMLKDFASLIHLQSKPFKASVKETLMNQNGAGQDSIKKDRTEQNRVEQYRTGQGRSPYLDNSNSS